MEIQYFIQAEKRGHKLLMNPEVYEQIKKIVKRRVSDRGDKIFFGREMPNLDGIPIIICLGIAFLRNGFKQHILLRNFNKYS